jgi:hypothetical protein
MDLLRYTRIISIACEALNKSCPPHTGPGRTSGLGPKGAETGMGPKREHSNDQII